VDRLRSIDRFTPEAFAAEPEEPEPEAPVAEQARSRFAGLDRYPLSIEEARKATLEDNLDLKVALVDPAIASQRQREEEARFEAVFRPTINYREDDAASFNVTSSNQQESLLSQTGVDIPLRQGGRVSVDLIEQFRQTSNPFVTLGTSYDSALQFSLSQPLLRNAGRRTNTHAIRIAAYEQQISQAQTKLEVIRQIAAVDRSYWRLYAAKEALKVSQQQYELALAQLERARRRVRAGAAPDVEVIRAEAGLAQRLETIIRDENAVLLQQRELKRIMNIPDLGIESTLMVDPTTPPEPIHYEFDAPVLVLAAIQNRMELLELELRLAQDASTIDFNKNQALPLVTLDYTYRLAGLGPTFRSSNAQIFDNRFQSWSMGLSASIPIGNEAAKARVQQAILSRLQRLSTREAREQAVTQEVLNAVDTVEAGWQRIMAARQSTAASARTFQAEQRQFDVGARTSTDVLDAAASLAEAQLAEIRAVTDYQIALVDLAFATGTLLGASKVRWEPRDASPPPAPIVQAAQAEAPSENPAGEPLER